MNPKAFLIPLIVCMLLLGAGVAIDSQVQQSTGKTLVAHVLPPMEAVQANVKPTKVEEEIPLDALPETWQAWHLSLFLHDDWEQRPDEVRLVSHFSHDCRLLRLKGQCHTHIYTPANPIFEARYSKSVQSLPVVRLQEQDGKVIYQAGNTAQIPRMARKLGNDIAKAIKRCPFPRPRPKPPEPTPTPNPTPIPDMPVPDITPDQVDPEPADEEAMKELSDGQMVFVLVLLLTLSVGGAFLAGAKKDALG